MRQQLRQLSGDTAIYGVTTIVQRFLSFLLTPFYTHFLQPAGVGIQANIFTYIAFLMIFTNAGMEAAFFKFESASATPEEKRRVYWSAIAVNWLAAAFFSALIFLFPGQFNRLALVGLGPEDLYLLQMAAAIIFFDSISTVTLASLRMERRAKAFGAIKIATIVVNVAMNIWLVYGLRMGLTGVFLAGVIQSVVQFALTLFFQARKWPFTFDRDLAGPMLRFGLPTIASGFAMIGLQAIDRPIMKWVTNSDAMVGLYQSGFRLGIPMMLFVSLFEFAWRPFFLQQAGQPNARQLYARVFTYFNLIAGAIFLAIGFFIVNLAATPIPFKNTTVIARPFWSGLVVVPLVLTAYIFNGWYTNFIVGIYIEKKTKALPWITGLGALIKAGLCFALIPALGLLGGGWATLIAYLIMAWTLYFYIRRHYPIPYEWLRIAKIAAGVALLWGLNTFLLDFYDHSLRAGLIRLGLLACFPVWLFLIRFFRPGEQQELARFLPFLRPKEGT